MALLPVRSQVPPPKPVVIVISGPSGVGKDTVVARLKELREDLYFVVTATSRCALVSCQGLATPWRGAAPHSPLLLHRRPHARRPKRSSEVEGRDYFFVARDKFEQWIADDMLLEHALVYGDYKGIPRQQVSQEPAHVGTPPSTPSAARGVEPARFLLAAWPLMPSRECTRLRALERSLNLAPPCVPPPPPPQVDDALRAGTDVVLRIDVQGAATVKRLLPDAITIFVTAEDEATLVQRLVARKTESADKLAVRVRTARAEVARVHEFDYVVVNGTGALETCVAQVSGIIDAEKARVSRRYAGVARGAPVGLQDASQQ